MLLKGNPGEEEEGCSGKKLKGRDLKGCAKMDMNSPSVVLAFSNFKIIGLSEKNHDTTH